MLASLACSVFRAAVSYAYVPRYRCVVKPSQNTYSFFDGNCSKVVWETEGRRVARSSSVAKDRVSPSTNDRQHAPTHRYFSAQGPRYSFE